jgi:hypothetical protein
MAIYSKPDTQPDTQPSVQPDVQHSDARIRDARGRTDEYSREYVATEGGYSPARSNGRSAVELRRSLLDRLEKSAQTLRHTAESVESRGLKLLLKVMAQERVQMFNVLRQAIGKEPVDPLDPAERSPATSMQQGLKDIQTSMTVQREGRANLALSHLIEEEDKLLAAYTEVLADNVPESARIELEAQRARVAQFYSRIASVDKGGDPIVARVFDQRIEGENAVARLKELGLDASQIDAAPFTQMALPSRPTTVASASPRTTMVAGAYTGAIVGGIAGLVLATFVWMAPQLVGWVTVGGWVLLIGAILIGAVFGAVFGLLIGQNKREDDFAVTADSLINGEILVVAYPQPQQVARVEEVLQVHHERELNR